MTPKVPKEHFLKLEHAKLLNIANDYISSVLIDSN